MTSFTLSTTLERPFEETVAAVREQLAEAGFGVLTEIDLKATLKAKLDVDVAPQLVLGACRPQLAHQALATNPSIAALLPCNVVLEPDPAGGTRVSAVDPRALMPEDEFAELAGEAADGLRGALEDAGA